MATSGIGAFSPDAPIADVLREIDAQGCAIVENLVDTELLGRLNQDLDAAIDETAPGSRASGATADLWKFFHGANTKRFTRLAARSPAFAEFMENPVMTAWADKALLPICGSYWLNTGQAMIVGPGEPAQVLHRDQDNWPVFSAIGVGAPEVTVSCMLALSDFTEAAGATRAVPGSHRWDDFARAARPEETVGAVMPVGAGLLYSGKVIHGAGANRTKDQWRRGLHLSFVAGWLRPEEAHTLSVPYAIARGYSERVQALLGYGSYDPYPHRGGRLWLVDFEDARAHLAADAGLAHLPGLDLGGALVCMAPV